ncbi:MAG: AraC family transcriptional regulator [Planctomycetes bacterium]|nr:AraC family transcriptional regulator [Planctomycetota bacterium]
MKEKLSIPPALQGHLWNYVWSGQTHPMHRHDELEFNLVTRGSAQYLFRDRRSDVRRHSLVWLFPGQEHILLKRSPGFEMWIFVIRPNWLKLHVRTRETKPLLAFDPPGSHCRPLAPAAAQNLVALMQRVREARHEVDRYNAALPHVLHEAWAAYRAAPEDAAADGLHPAVEQAAFLLREEAAEWDVVQLARRVGLSPNRLSRLFKRQLGQSLTDFRNRRRLERFDALYGDGASRSLIEAALAAGFGSYPQFHRVFKQTYGRGPRAWLRERRGAG